MQLALLTIFTEKKRVNVAKQGGVAVKKLTGLPSARRRLYSLLLYCVIVYLFVSCITKKWYVLKIARRPSCNSSNSYSSWLCDMHIMVTLSLSQADRRPLLIKGGTVVNSDCKVKADVYCEDGIIKYVPSGIYSF